MFGTLRPLGCTLADPQQQVYQRFYCGLCKTMGDQHGQLSRGMTGHDAIFLAVLADALLDAEASGSRCRCPLLPVVHRETIDETSPPMRFAAAMQVLLADQFLADRAMDGRRGYRALRRLLSGAVADARNDLRAHRIDLDALDGFEQEQARQEALAGCDLEGAAAPTARALAVVFEQIVHLPGASARLRSSASRRALAALGSAIGRVIYWTDALEDLRADYLSGSFNPCLSFEGTTLVIDPERVTSCVARLTEQCERIEQTLRELPLRRHQGLLSNILVEQLAGRARRATRIGASAARSREALRRRRAARWRGQLQERWLAVAAALWVWLGWAQSAFAQRLPRALPSAPRVGPDAGDDCPDGGLWPDGGLDGGLPERCRKPDAGVIDGGAGHAQGTLDAGLPDASALDAGQPRGGGPLLEDPCGLRACGRGLCGDLVDACCKNPLDGVLDGCCRSFGGCLDGCLHSCGKGCCDSGCKGCSPDACCKGCCDSTGKDCGKACGPDACCKDCCKGGGGCPCAEGPPVDLCGS
jgi:hypothetical protein